MGSEINEHLGPQLPIWKNWRDGYRTLGVLLPLIPICPKCPFAPVPIFKHLGVTGIRHLGYSFPAKVHFFQVPICPTAHLQTFGETGIGILEHLEYTLLGHLSTHFPQISICPKSCPGVGMLKRSPSGKYRKKLNAFYTCCLWVRTAAILSSHLLTIMVSFAN